MFKLGNIDIPPKQPGHAWMVEHAGTLQTLYGRGEDGLTPWHRLKGKPWRVPLPSFGEVVEFKLRARHKLEARWRPGVFLGVRRITTEKIVGDKLGTYVVQSIRRVDEGRRWNADMFLSVSGVPWNPGGASETGEGHRTRASASHLGSARTARCSSRGTQSICARHCSSKSLHHATKSRAARLHGWLPSMRTDARWNASTRA